jgi:N-methylhydantoinase A
LPTPFVPRHLCFEVTERMDSKGQVRVPLSVADLETVAVAIARAGVSAVAIMFIHAYANPEHERLAADFLRTKLPGTAVTASHEISRQWREYERSQPLQGTIRARLLPAELRLKGDGDDFSGRG